MRFITQPSLLIVSTLFVALFLQHHPARADANDDYYKQLRKLKKYDPEAVERIKRETIDAERIKQMNAISRANFQHNAEVDAKPKKTAPKFSDQEENKAPSTGPNGEKAGPPRKVAGGAKKKPSAPVETPAPEKKVTVTKKSGKPAAGNSPTSAPIKVEHNTPDELSFPGDNGKDTDEE